MHKSLIKIPFTKKAFEDLHKKLLIFEHEEEELLLRLQAAREMGDLSENGAYKYAKFELGNVRRMLNTLRHQLSFGQVVEPTKNTTQASFGHIISLKNQKTSLSFQLVSEYESNPALQKISTKSPIGKAVLGKKVGDTILVTHPNGNTEYTLISIK